MELTREDKEEIRLNMPEKIEKAIEGCEFAVLLGSSSEEGLDADKDIDIRAYFKKTDIERVWKKKDGKAFDLFKMDLNYAMNHGVSFYEEYYNIKEGIPIIREENYKQWLEKFEEGYYNIDYFQEVLENIEDRDSWISFYWYLKVDSIIKGKGILPPKNILDLSGKSIRRPIREEKIPNYPSREELRKEFKEEGKVK